MYRILFPLNVLGSEQWCDELLGKSIQGGFQVFRLYIEEVIGVLIGGVGVVTAAMLADKTLVFSCLRVLDRAKKQHVLKKVGQSLVFVWILAATNVDIECSSGFFGCR